MKLTQQNLYKLIQEQYELSAQQRENLLILLTTDIVSAIQALELINTLDIGYAKAGLLGDALMLSGRDYKKRELHDFLLKATEEEFFKNVHPSFKIPPSYKTGKLKEATGEQKRQQRRDAYNSRERQRKKMKAKIKRSQVKEPVESPIKGEPTDFDPMQDMAKIFKDKGYGVRIDGEEIED